MKNTRNKQGRQLSIGIEEIVYEKIRVIAAKNKQSMSGWCADKLRKIVEVNK